MTNILIKSIFRFLCTLLLLPLVLVSVFGKCGDGRIQAGEECDDGNTINGDGCSSTCQIERNVFGKRIFSCSGSPSRCKYLLPIGIPRPVFGIVESRFMYAKQIGYSIHEDHGPFSHYVDNRDSCSDSSTADNVVDSRESNPGSLDRPRCTLPYVLVPGNVVLVNGGYYTQGNYASNTALFVTGDEGDKDRPIFISGVNGAQFDVTSIHLFPEYIIFEGFDVGPVETATIYLESNYSCVRNCNCFGDNTWSTRANIYPKAPFCTIFNNSLHDKGDYQTTSQNDAIGALLLTNTWNIWVLDNEMWHLGGDGTGSCHRGNHSCGYWWIGRNLIYENRENAIDLKEVKHVVLSQNDFHSMTLLGIIMMIHTSNFGYSANSIWVIFNKMYNFTMSAIVSYLGADHIYVFGNLFYINEMSSEPTIAAPWSYRTFFIHNTFVRTYRGLAVRGALDYEFPGPTPFNAQTIIMNNLFYEIKNYRFLEVYEEEPDSYFSQNSKIKNNILYSTVHPRVFWSDENIECENCVYGVDPLLVDVDNHDFRLMENSTARGNASNDHGIFAVFREMYEHKFIEYGSEMDTLNICCGIDGNCFDSKKGLKDIGAHQFDFEEIDSNGTPNVAGIVVGVLLAICFVCLFIGVLIVLVVGFVWWKFKNDRQE